MRYGSVSGKPDRAAGSREVERRTIVPETNRDGPVEPQRLDSADSDSDISVKPPSNRDSWDGIELKDLRAAFRKLEESKTHFVKRVQEIRRISSENASTRTQAELKMKDAQDQLAESNTQLRAIKEEVSSLRAELNTANGLLEEIDKTLA